MARLRRRPACRRPRVAEAVVRLCGERAVPVAAAAGTRRGPALGGGEAGRVERGRGADAGDLPRASAGVLAHPGRAVAAGRLVLRALVRRATPAWRSGR